MAPRISISDQVKLERTAPDFDLTFLHERIPLGELIRSRVFREVKDCNAKVFEHFHGPVQPTETEQTLSGHRFLTKIRTIGGQVPFQLALGAFEAGGFLVLVDNQQVTDLDAELHLTTASEVVFLELVPLVRG